MSCSIFYVNLAAILLKFNVFPQISTSTHTHMALVHASANTVPVFIWLIIQRMNIGITQCLDNLNIILACTGEFSLAWPHPVLQGHTPLTEWGVATQV